MVGRVVIGTSHGDFHGLGKRIVTGCLKARMIEVTDLGLNVSPERFVDEALVARCPGHRDLVDDGPHGPGENGCRRVRQILQERGLEDRFKIVVGGAPYRFDQDLYKVVEADAWAENGVEAATVIAELIREVRR